MIMKANPKIFRVSQKTGDLGLLIVWSWFEDWKIPDPERADVSVQAQRQEKD